VFLVTRVFFNVKFNGDECVQCHNFKNYNKTSISNMSAENDMDSGELPDIFNDLSLYEERILGLIHPSMIVKRLRYGMQASEGHSIFFNYDLNKLVQYLPQTHGNIVLIGRIRSDGKIKAMRVRKNKIVACLKYLQKNNKYYTNAAIDWDLVNAMPIDDFGEATYFVEDPTIPNDGTQVVDEDLNTDSAIVSELLSMSDDQGKNKVLKKLKFFEFGCPLLEPVNEFEMVGLFNKAYPHLFPNGTADMLLGGVWRPHHKVNYRDYAYHIMSHKYDRFRNDVTFKFVLANICYRNELLASARLALNKKTGICTDMDIDTIRQELKKEKSASKTCLNMLKKNNVGSEHFWLNERNKLEHLCKQIGFPALFVTMSCADRHWADLKTLYGAVDNANLRDLVTKNPFPTVVYFTRKVNVFLNDFFPQIFNAHSYHGRYEIQSRGSVHFHGLIWIQEYSDLFIGDTISVVKIAEFIDKVVSAINPHFNVKVGITAEATLDLSGDDSVPLQPDTLPTADILLSKHPSEIYDVLEHGSKLLNACMRHSKCGSHCQRVVNGKAECRFHYPKPVRESTLVFASTDSKCLQVEMKRNDPLVVCHNKFMCGCFNANCDLSVCVSKKNLFAYLLKYIAKAEKKSDKMERIIKLLENLDITDKDRLIRKWYMIMGRKEMSAHECVMYLLKIPMVESSASFVYVNTSGSRLLTKEGLALSQNYKYARRPEKYHHLSSYNFWKHYDFAKNGKVIKRCSKKFTVIVPVPYVKPHTEEFYKRECMLHFAWSIDSELTKPDGATWEAMFKSLKNAPYAMNVDFDDVDLDKVDLVEMVGFINQSNPLQPATEIDDFLEIHCDDVVTYDKILHAEGDFIERPDYDWHASQLRYNQQVVVDFVKEMKRKDESEKVYPFHDLKTLNAEQMQVYNHVKNHFDDHSADKKPLYFSVQGAPGTGKSYTIKAIQYLLKDKHACAAFTGSAASHLAFGNTIHSLLGMGISGASQKLSSKSQTRLREGLNGVDYILIDEFSMISIHLFGSIDERLRQIFPENSSPFAGFNVILFGDLYQLGPVNGRPLYWRKNITGHFALLGESVYKLFVNKAILTISQRHITDARFFEFLERAKTSTCTREDVLYLTQSLYDRNETEFNDNAIFLYFSNAKCKMHNHRKLAELQSELNPVAVFTSEGKYKNQKNKKKPPRAGVITQRVCLAVGATVMLRTNLSLFNGLTNGSIGIVRDIV
jgi:hypothetical protein